MNIITSNDVPHLPESVFLAYSVISEQSKLDNPFLDIELISETRNKKRIYEHVSSRELLLNMLESKNMDPNEFNVHKNSDGKPFGSYKGEPVHLSFSHTNEWVLCGLSSSLDLGIDAEKVDRAFRPELLKRIASDEEIKALNSCTPIAIWTMKEAVVKSLGIGIRRDLREIRIEKEEEHFSFSADDVKLRILTGVREQHQISVAWSTAN